MTKAILAAAAAALAIAPAALADGHGDKFTAIDSDGDLAITEAEFVVYATADGTVTGDEASLQFAVLAGEDGVLTREELEAAMAVQKDPADHDVSTTIEMDSEMGSADPAGPEGK